MQASSNSIRFSFKSFHKFNSSKESSTGGRVNLKKGREFLYINIEFPEAIARFGAAFNSG